MKKAEVTAERWAQHLEYHRNLRLANLEKARASKREYASREHVKAKRRERDSSPEAVARRRAYALTPEAKVRAKEIYQTRLANDPEFRSKRNAHGRMLRTGFSQELILALVQSQGNRCAICSNSFDERRMHADHCHTTGKPRGLLCHHCNLIEGMISRIGIDPVEFGHRLVSYLSDPPALRAK